MKNIHDKLEVLKDEMKNTNRSRLRFASFNAFSRYRAPSKSWIAEEIKAKRDVLKTTARVI